MRILTAFAATIGLGAAIAAAAAGAAPKRHAAASGAHRYHIKTRTMYYSFFSPTSPPLPGPRR